jgi:ATP-dependent RNA helicase DDX24/MAK5
LLDSEKHAPKDTAAQSKLDTRESDEEFLDEEEWEGIQDTITADGGAEIDEEHDSNQNTFSKLEELEPEVDLPEWSKMKLSPPTLQALSKLGFTAPTPIQSLAIPRIMQGHDLIGKATTGPGKTLAFGIPLLEHILSQPDPKSLGPSALVIAPTRELAKQIVGHLEAIAQCSLGAMTVCNVTGGLAVQKQLRILQKKPTVIVGTPGRLWEVFNNPQIKEMQLDQAIKKIQFLVLDEADRLLQDGHFAEIEKILDFVKGAEDRQTLVFSATFQKQLQQKLKGKKRFEGNVLSKDDALGNLVDLSAN